MRRLRPGPGPDILPAMFAWSEVCGERPSVMGIVNVTPDSFSDGGRFLDPDAAVAHGLELARTGADILVVERLAAEAGVPVSIDTSKASVAAVALAAGATIVNDVAAGGDEAMFDV